MFRQSSRVLHDVPANVEVQRLTTSYRIAPLLLSPPPPPPARIRNYVCVYPLLVSSLHSSLFLLLLLVSRRRVTTTSTLNYASILICFVARSSNAARPPIPFSRGNRGDNCPSLSRGEESIKMDARRFLAMAMSVAREDASSRGWPGSNLSHCLRATNMQIQNRLREHFHIRNDAVTREIQRDVSWIISFLGRTGMFRARLLRGIRMR